MTNKYFAGQCKRCNQHSHKVKDCKISRRKQTKQSLTQITKQKQSTEVYNIGWVVNPEMDISYDQQSIKKSPYEKEQEEGWGEASAEITADWLIFPETNKKFSPKEDSEEISDEQLWETLQNR